MFIYSRSRFALAAAGVCAIDSLLCRVVDGSANNLPVALAPISFNVNTLVNNANGTITGGTPADIDTQNNVTYYTSAYGSTNPFPAGTSYLSPNGAGTTFAPQAAGQNNTMLINSSTSNNQYNTPYSTVGTIYLSTPMAIGGSSGFSVLFGGINNDPNSGNPNTIDLGYTLTFSDGYSYTLNNDASINHGLYPNDYTSTAYTKNLPVGTANTFTGTINGGSTYVSEYDVSLSNNPGNMIDRKLVSISFSTFDYDNYGPNFDYPGHFDNESVGIYAISGLTTAITLTWTGATSGSWSTSASNFTYNNIARTWLTSGPYNVLFNDSTGSTNVVIASTVNPGSVTFNNNTKNYVISGAAIADSSYATGIGMSGTGTVTFNNVNTFTGPINANSGQIIVGSTGAIASNQALVSAGASILVQAGGQLSSGSINLIVAGTLTLADHGTYPKALIQASAVSISGTSGNWSGKIDLNNNDLIAHNGSLGQITNQVIEGYANGNWNGTGGITSTSASANTKHLTALGVIQNSIDQTATGSALYTTFDQVSVSATDVLVKYTYYGDTDLNGKVDGGDYSRIDNAYLNNQSAQNPLTGWFNGDFNYDGVINGSDYTLIDNAFNTQGSVVSSIVASPDAIATSQIAGAPGTTPVPEPATLGFLSVAVLGLRRNRSRVRSCTKTA